MILNLFDLTLKLKGFPIEQAEKRLQEIQNISEEMYGDYTEMLCKDILAFHQKNNAYYQDIAGKQNIENWEEVPVLTKAHLQVPLAQRLSKGYTEKSVYVNKTSGSSGNPFVFAKDKFCHAMTWAEIKDRFRWHGINFNRDLQARFYGIPLDGIGYQKERLKDRLSKRYRFPIFDLSDAKLATFLTQFRRKKFVYINGYTSAIVLFAKYLNRQGVLLKEVCPTLSCCIVTSEMLYDSDKQLMEGSFGVPVYNEYGASELDLIAFENKQQQFVVNAETLYVEVVDENNKQVPNGIPGRIVITSLFNKAHPMIRYDIGDTGVLHKDSTRKHPILEKLIGRTNDIAILPSGKSVPGLTFYYVTKSVIEDDGNIKEFVIEQIEKDTFKIIYTSEMVLTAIKEQEIKKALYQYLENDLQLIFERVALLDRKNRGKLKQFISFVNN